MMFFFKMWKLTLRNKVILDNIHGLFVWQIECGFVNVNQLGNKSIQKVPVWHGSKLPPFTIVIFIGYIKLNKKVTIGSQLMAKMYN